MITLDALTEDGIAHGFFTREGGVSEGIFASLNCGFGSDDDPAKVAINRERAARALTLGPERLVTCHQIHGAEVVHVTQPWRHEDRPRADGMVTTQPGVALGILTADCAPVLFADPDARVIGAAHAGWRGALDGVLEAVVAAMTRLGAQRTRIVAGIGPCIAQASYEVGPEFPEPFLASDGKAAAFFRPAARPGHFLFDLPGFVQERLDRLRLGRVAFTGGDTAAEAPRFFSYRRSRLKGEPDYGRELSAIALK